MYTLIVTAKMNDIDPPGHSARGGVLWCFGQPQPAVKTPAQAPNADYRLRRAFPRSLVSGGR